MTLSGVGFRHIFMVLEGNFCGQERTTRMFNYFSRQTKYIPSLNCPQESSKAQRHRKETAIAPGKAVARGSLVSDGIHVDGFKVNHSRLCPCGIREQRHSLKRRALVYTRPYRHTVHLLSITALSGFPASQQAQTISI